YNIPDMDIVMVDLYPFEKTVASGASEEEIIEKIDIGGVALIRAAAKNYKDVFCVSSKADYTELLELSEAGKGRFSTADNRRCATRAFHVSAHYDTAIRNYFEGEKEEFDIHFSKAKALRYGENPHQKAKFYGDLDVLFEQLHGKALSYNNLQ